MDAFNSTDISAAANQLFDNQPQPATPVAASEPTVTATEPETLERVTDSADTSPTPLEATPAAPEGTTDSGLPTPDSTPDPFQEFGGRDYIQTAVELSNSLYGQEFDTAKFLDNIYSASNNRYQDIVGEIVRTHADDISKMLFGKSVAEMQAQPAAAPMQRGQDAEILEQFNMSLDDWELLPEEAQSAIRSSYTAQQQAVQQAQAQQAQIAAQEVQNKQEQWMQSNRNQIGTAMDTLKITDPQDRARIEALTWGALSQDAVGKEIWQTAVTHAQNGDFSLLNGISPRLNTLLSTLVAKESEMVLERNRLRLENDQLKRQMAGQRIEIPQSGASNQAVPPAVNGLTRANVWDMDSINADLARVKAGGRV